MIFGPSGEDRLSLYYFARAEDEGGSDFHSLVWEHCNSNEWQIQCLITRDQFKSENNRRRWISELHSLDLQRGIAVIKVAEGNRPEGAFPVWYDYSWRAWDLLKNREIEKLKNCASPFEPFA
jgi:hypothetical protein